MNIDGELKNLCSRNRSVVSKAENTLAKLSASELPLLVQASSSNNDLVRCRLVMIMSRLQYHETFDCMLPFLGDRSIAVRFDALVAFGRLADVRAIPLLIGEIVLGTYLHNGLDGAASQSVRVFGDAALPFVVPHLIASDERIRARFASLLGDIPSDESFRLLSGMVNDNSQAVILEVIEAIGNIEHTDSCGILAQFVRNEIDDIAKRATYWFEFLNCKSEGI